MDGAVMTHLLSTARIAVPQAPGAAPSGSHPDLLLLTTARSGPRALAGNGHDHLGGNRRGYGGEQRSPQVVPAARAAPERHSSSPAGESNRRLVPPLQL